MTINIFIWQDGGFRLYGTIHDLEAIPDYVRDLAMPWRVEAYKN